MLTVYSTYHWRNRWGDATYEVTFEASEPTTVTEFDTKARECGWPGHRGGFWRYLRDDIVRFWRRVEPFQGLDANGN